MKTWWLPFTHAMNGIRQAVKEERHMKVHFTIGLIVSGGCLVFTADMDGTGDFMFNDRRSPQCGNVQYRL